MHWTMTCYAVINFFDVFIKLSPLFFNDGSCKTVLKVCCDSYFTLIIHII